MYNIALGCFTQWSKLQQTKTVNRLKLYETTTNFTDQLVLAMFWGAASTHFKMHEDARTYSLSVN